MPLGLGVFLGAGRFGGPKQILILDIDPNGCQRFISDIVGQVIHAHGGETDRLIAAIATWLRDEYHHPSLTGGHAMAEEYRNFADDLAGLCTQQQLHPDEISFKTPNGRLTKRRQNSP